MRFALIFSLLIAILAVVFALYNPAETEIYIGPDYVLTSPLALVIIVTLLAGVLIGALFSVPNRLRSRSRIKKLEKRIAELETSPGTMHETVVVEEEGPADPRPIEPGASSGGAAETERLASETRRMAEEAQRRAAEAERKADNS
jgi:putative membrane protein